MKKKQRLFPEHLSNTKHGFLYELYMNPFENNETLCQRANVSYSVAWDAVHRLFDVGTRRNKVGLFYSLGYIHIYVTGISCSPAVPKRLLNIVKVWRSKPYATNQYVADALGVSKKTINNRTVELYRFNGYTPPSNNPDVARLGFFWYIGWFDVQQLKQDAEDQYNEVCKQA